jgi:hypothetical protein
VRCVSCSKREVTEEGPIRPHAFGVGDHRDGVVHEIRGEVVPVLRSSRRVDVMIVDHQLRVELVGFAVEEPVEPVEPASQRPLIERPCRRTLIHRREMPFPDRERGVACVAKNLGHGRGMVGDVPELRRVPRDEVGDGAQAHGMVGPSGQQRGARRRAQRRDVEVGELQSAGRQRINVGCFDIGAEAAELTEAGVVEQHEHHVGRGLTRMGRLTNDGTDSASVRPMVPAKGGRNGADAVVSNSDMVTSFVRIASRPATAPIEPGRWSRSGTPTPYWNGSPRRRPRLTRPPCGWVVRFA